VSEGLLQSSQPSFERSTILLFSQDNRASPNSSHCSSPGTVTITGAGDGGGSTFFLCWLQEEQNSLWLLLKILRTVPQSLQNSMHVPLPAKIDSGPNLRRVNFFVAFSLSKKNHFVTYSTANEQERAVFLLVCFLSASVWAIFSTLEISFLLFKKEFREGTYLDLFSIDRG
jgi:hypothetical protein